jgi:nucleoside-diphosphate-sugar epimerase
MTEAFIKRDFEVTVVDDLRCSVVEPDDLDASVRVMTVQDYLRIRLELCDLVVHCAAPVGSAGVLPYKGRIVSEISEMTAQLVESCIESAIPLVNISTSEVYGFSGKYSESDDCRVPVVPSTRIEYAVAKLGGEFTVMNSIHRGLDAISVRPFNVAGPRQRADKGFVLPTFVEQALAKRPLTVFGDGGQKRAFTAVTDLCDFVCDYALKSPLDGSVYNIGNPENETTILDLAQSVCGRFHLWPKIDYTDGKAVFGDDYEEAEGRVKTPDISKAQGLGWNPKVGLDDLIDQTAAHYWKLQEV